VAHIIQVLLRHGYLVVFVWLLAEQAAIPLPSIPLLLACGALARTGRLSLPLVVLSGLVAVVIADNIWFQLGKRRGPKILNFICRVSLEPDSCVRRTENVFIRYGMRSLLGAKFIPGLNAVAAPLAGSSGASLARFLFFDSIGAVLWITAYLSIGYAFSDQLETVADYAARMGSGLAVVVLGPPVAWILWKLIQRRRFMKKLAVARITPEELSERLESGEDVFVVDLRTGLASHTDSVPGAVRISAEELPARHTEIPRDREIVLFCS
jgi:membrane protein DedA with SNARE-associated domain